MDGARRDADDRVSEGERVNVTLPSLDALPGTDFESWILFEDKRLFVMNKPSGLLMHPLGS